MEPGEEKQFVRNQRVQLAQLHDQLVLIRAQKSELAKKQAAMQAIKEKLQSKTGSDEERTRAVLQELLSKKRRMEEDSSRSMTVQLHERAFEIDFDAY